MVGPGEDLLNRPPLEEKLATLPEKGAGKVSADVQQMATALLGAAKNPDFALSSLVADYENVTRLKRQDMSDMQLHKWRLPLTRAVRNFVELIGDKSIRM